MRLSYLLEVERNGKVVKSFALPPTGHYSHTRESATDFEWTLGEFPHIHHSGVREEGVTLKGSSGYQARLGHSAEGNLMFALGPALFREFERFLQDYEKTAALAERGELQQSSFDSFGRDLSGSDDTAVEYRMIYRSIEEEKDLYVEPVRFDWSRDVERGNFLINWELQLRAYGKASQRPKDGFARARDVAKSAARVIDGAAAYVAQANAFLTEGNRTLDAFKEPIRAVGRVADQAGQVALQARGIRAFPLEVVEELFHTADRAVTALEEAFEAIAPELADKSRPFYYRVMDSLAGMRKDALDLLGSSGWKLGQPTDANPNATAVDRVVVSSSGLVVEHTMQAGETLADLASTWLGNRSLWVEIARLNKMPGPVTKPDGAPLLPGDKVFVPTAELDGGAELGPDGDPYGTDLLLGPDGDFVGVGNPPTDWATVSGPANLNQGLGVRLRSIQGQSSIFPQLGLPPTVGETPAAGFVGFLASQMRTQLLRDRRVRRVRSIDLVDEGDTIRGEALVEVVGGRELRLVTAVA